ncbi:hypothetical protein BCR39DRAFT_533329 [Naematelia encephala]|uniref:Uncharacterized protein n=1 Tax=Naematelia encephala TaxID=71784 RepID=A0A1Y2B2A2_9TREE|nr:hypothetical protein BCR39DRAFT_533329 [Naematelia encephala]
MNGVATSSGPPVAHPKVSVVLEPPIHTKGQALVRPTTASSASPTFALPSNHMATDSGTQENRTYRTHDDSYAVSTSTLPSSALPLTPEPYHQSLLGDAFDEEALRARLEVEVNQKELEIEREKEKERLIAGLDNEDLNALLRTFDKHVQYVHVAPPSYDQHIPRGLDLQAVPEESFSLDKVRSSLERFYSSIIIGVLRLVHEIQRIRNWEEGGHRTVIALAVYSYAWYCNLIITTLLLFLSILILFPKARRFCFGASVRPHHPIHSLDDNYTTKVAASRARDEWSPAATEFKATNWAQSISDTLVSVSSPKSSDQMESVTQGIQTTVDEQLGRDMRKKEIAGATMPGDAELSRKDKAVSMYAQPGMRVVAGMADKWERFANALNPPPDAGIQPRRLQVFMYLIAPVLPISTFVSERMVSRAFGIIFGFLMFGQPLITYVIDELDRAIPHWKSRLLLENNLLENVPTNSQLVLRLLRNAEHHSHPIPPAPTQEDLEAEGASPAESENEENEDDQDEDENDEVEDSQEGESRKKKMVKKMGKASSKVKDGARTKARKAWDKLGVAKEEGFAILTGHRKVDFERKAEHVLDKAHVSKDSKPARALLDKLPSAPRAEYPETPSRFYVHHAKHGPGHIIIYPPIPSSDTPARIEFTTIRRVPSSQNASIKPGDSPAKGHLVVSVNDIVGLKKVGMGIPGRLAVGWALDAEGAGGTGMEIEVVRRNDSEAIHNAQGPTVAQGKQDTIVLKSIVRRNELFDRLLAIGDQRWEMH